MSRNLQEETRACGRTHTGCAKAGWQQGGSQTLTSPGPIQCQCGRAALRAADVLHHEPRFTLYRETELLFRPVGPAGSKPDPGQQLPAVRPSRAVRTTLTPATAYLA